MLNHRSRAEQQYNIQVKWWLDAHVSIKISQYTATGNVLVSYFQRLTLLKKMTMWHIEVWRDKMTDKTFFVKFFWKENFHTGWVIICHFPLLLNRTELVQHYWYLGKRLFKSNYPELQLNPNLNVN